MLLQIFGSVTTFQDRLSSCALLCVLYVLLCVLRALLCVLRALLCVLFACVWVLNLLDSNRELRGRLWHAAAFKTLEQAGSAIAVEVRYDADWLIILQSDGGGVACLQNALVTKLYWNWFYLHHLSSTLVHAFSLYKCWTESNWGCQFIHFNLAHFLTKKTSSSSYLQNISGIKYGSP